MADMGTVGRGSWNHPHLLRQLGQLTGDVPAILISPDLGDEVAHTVGSAMTAGGLEVTMRVRVCAICHVAKRVVGHVRILLPYA